MRTRSQSRNLNRHQQQAPPAFVEPFNLEEPIENPAPPLVPMADNRTMAQLLQAPTEGYEDAIVIPEINANFELKHGLINLVQNKQFFGHDKEDPHAHIRYFNKITSTMRFPDVPSTSIKLMLFPFSLEDLDGCKQIRPPGFPPIQTIKTVFYQNLENSFNQNRGTNSNQNRGNNFYQGQVYQPPTSQPPVYQAQPYQAPAQQVQGVSKTDFENYVKANDAVLRNMQNQGQGLQNQIANLTDMLSKFVNANTASSSGTGTLPSNTVTNPKEDLKGITTRSGVAYKGPTIPTTSSPKVVERETEVTKDTMPPANNGSTEDVQPLVWQSNLTMIHRFSSSPNLTPFRGQLIFPFRRKPTLFLAIEDDPTSRRIISAQIRKDLEREAEVTKDTMPPANNGSTEDVQPSVVPVVHHELISEPVNAPVSASMPNQKASISFPSRRNDERRREKANDQIEKFYEIFRDLSFEISFTDALMLIPNQRFSIKGGPWVSPVHCVPKKGGMTIVKNDENDLIPTRLVTGWRVCVEYRKLNEATRKDHFPLPFMDQKLERLAGNQYYCFHDGFSGYFQIPIDPKDQEKTTFTCPYRTFAYRRMPFGLCNAPGTFQRCMMAIFHDMIEKTMEVFMDDFSVFGDSFSTCLSHLDKMLKRCEDTNLVLNWEKSHFMVKEGIVLGHKISKSGIEVDRAKVDVIAKLPHPTTVKGVRSFLGHTEVDANILLTLMGTFFSSKQFSIGSSPTTSQSRKLFFRETRKDLKFL
ncbi:reverse transcriptase domain-containing protein [Tanacetum coccineum]